MTIIILILGILAFSILVYFLLKTKKPVITTITTTVLTDTPSPIPSVTYNYTAREQSCADCTLINLTIEISDTRSDLNINKWYSGNTLSPNSNFKIIGTGGTGGQLTSLAGSGYVNCEDIPCV